ncbi:AI-2E family transporter [Chitinimonas sp.]|uniref:AI-2E family transporter n=1 Tax=Chitinimonas sp. TaxID=1934313 RepID=UPI002F9526E0
MGSKTLTAATNQLGKLVGTAIVLALLYLGRDVLIPITLAVILSLLVAPLVRRLRRLGLGHTGSVTVSVVLLTLGIGLVGVGLGSQIVRMGASLPQYEDTIRSKLQTLDELTLGKLGAITGQADRLVGKLSHGSTAAPSEVGAELADSPASQPIPVEVHEPEPKPIELVSRVAASVLGPLETAGVVFIVLVFVLLEHEALRDRFIRLIGGGNLRATTLAVNDAGERLSRFFVSQFAVNVLVGLLLWAGLALAGLPQALLWGTTAALLRFVPYVGIWIAAICATLLAAAVSPGWGLAIATIALFFVIEFVIAQVVEPQLYGHTTGLSPLSVVVAAIFWSWIWGPVGLLLSTPLTLCLVVAGRYIPALNFLEVLLGEVPALTMQESFYQRALSGDAEEIIDAARRFLKRKPLAAYCDEVLIPAMHIAREDFVEEAISREEQLKVGSAIAAVLIALEGPSPWWRRGTRISVLDDMTLGRQLRARREQQVGQWQGSLDVPPGSVVLAIGVGNRFDELAAELMVRVLRAQQVDARHISLEDLAAPPAESDKPELISTVFLVSVDPTADRERLATTAANLHGRANGIRVVMLYLLPGFGPQAERPAALAAADQTLYSCEAAVQLCRPAVEAAPAATTPQ